LDGDWEGWTRFFLDCVTEAAEDAVASAQRLHAVTAADRTNVAAHAVMRLHSALRPPRFAAHQTCFDSRSPTPDSR
jgi:hypothetical protein